MEVILAGGREGGALGFAIAEAGAAEVEVPGEQSLGLSSVDAFERVDHAGALAGDGEAYFDAPLPVPRCTANCAPEVHFTPLPTLPWSISSTVPAGLMAIS
jgi:hypothetical protein